VERFTCPRFNFAEGPVKNIKTDTSLAAYTSEIIGVNMYGGSHVVNLFNQKDALQKIYLCASLTLHNNIFLSQTLWSSSLHKSSIHMCIKERYAYTTGSQPLFWEPHADSKQGRIKPVILGGDFSNNW